MYEFILFDLDGTLLDTLDDLTSSVNYALRAFGKKERSREEVRAFVGNGIRLLIERAIGEKNSAEFEGVFSAFKTHYGEHCAVQTKPYDGVMQMLAALKAQGKRLAILSNKADFATKQLCTQYFGDLIELSIGERESEGIRKKPAPDAVFSVMEAWGATKQNTVYVGDSEVDIQTAQNAGIDCVLVTWGFRNEAFLKENGGKVFADTPEKLLQLLS
jgi:phosphoglycolate phosphatase